MPAFKNRCASTSTTTGTGNFTLSAVAIPTYQTIDAKIAVGESFDGWIEDTVSGLWECGNYKLSAANTLERTTVYDGSSGAGTLVNFTAGTKRVTVSVSAEFLNKVVTNDVTNSFAAANETPTTVLTSGATLTPDANKAYQTFTTNANFTIAAPVNRPAGKLRVYVVRIIYAGAHSATSMDAAYKYNGTAPAFSNASGKFDDLIISDDGTRITYELKAGYTS